MKWAFSDESIRGSTLVVAAVIVDTHAIADSRAQLRSFLRSNQRRVHMRKESSRRRRQFVEVVAAAIGEAVAVSCPIGVSIPLARDAALAALAADLAESGVVMWQLEWMVDAVQDRDRRVIASVLREAGRAGLQYDHRAPHEEPLLWAADAVAWLSSHQRPAWVRRIDLA